MFGWFKRRRRKKILADPWPEPWSLHLNRNVRLTWKMTPEEIAKLQRLIQIFVAEKNWEGCDGLELTGEMKVTIAAMACLMLLGGDESFCFDNVQSVLVYPHAFRRKTQDGYVIDEAVARAGEAWQGGPVILSWRDTLQGGRNEDDGHNLVIHEFAHALDGLDGEMGGSPVFNESSTAQRWRDVVKREYAILVDAEQSRRRTLLDHYGATNEAEFFAVSSETFFELPRELKREHPELFELLQKFYGVDPARWQR